MNGVEILSQISKTKWSDFDTAIGIMLIVIGSILLIISIWNLLNFLFLKKNFLLFVILLLNSSIFIIAFYTFINETAIYYTEYKVTISDSVNFNEFNERYEIIDQDGKIYTVKEKNYD